MNKLQKLYSDISGGKTIENFDGVVEKMNNLAGQSSIKFKLKNKLK